MADESSGTTVIIQNLLDRMAQGDATALEALLTHAMDRLSVIARRLLRNFGGEARIEMWTAEIISEAYPRLQRAIQDIKPASPAQFFGLARLQMQRVLQDRARAIPGAALANKPSTIPLSQIPIEDPPAPGAKGPGKQDHNDLMLDLVQTIGALPEVQAETTWLKLAGYTHREIAEFLGVHHDTVDVYWSKACVKLAKKLSPYLISK